MPKRSKGSDDMTRLTEEEAARLGEYYTTHTVNTDPSRPGFFARQKLIEKEHIVIELDGDTAKYIKAKSTVTKRTPAELISDMVNREIAAGQ